MSSSSIESINYDSRNMGQHYPDLRQYMVYYSQQHEDIRKPNDYNCFTNASQWYTQESKACSKKKRSNKRNVKGFAAWLDSKYVEFLREYDKDSTTRRTHVKTVYESLLQDSNTVSGPRQMNKKLKSPWKSSENVTNTVEAVNFIKDSNPSVKTIYKPQNFSFPLTPSDRSVKTSVKTIMKPKLLSRTVSEYCRSAKTEPCCPSSRYSLGEARQSVYEIHKSTSMCSIVKENGLAAELPLQFEGYKYNEYIWVPMETARRHEVAARMWNNVLYDDFHVPVEYSNINKGSKKIDKKQNQKKAKKLFKKKDKTQCQSVHFRDVICQCVQTKTDTSSQYMHEYSKRKTSNKHICHCPMNKYATNEDSRNSEDDGKWKVNNTKTVPHHYLPRSSKEKFSELDNGDEFGNRNTNNIKQLEDFSPENSKQMDNTEDKNNNKDVPNDDKNTKIKPNIDQSDNSVPDVYKETITTTKLENKGNSMVNDLATPLDGSVQTSDYSLILDSPLYVKIYRPERPDELEN